DEQIPSVVVHDPVRRGRAVESMEYRRRAVAADAIDELLLGIRDVGRAVRADRDIVREERAFGCLVVRGREIDHRDSLARVERVDAELRLPRTAAAENAAIRVADEQPVTRLVDLDADRRDELVIR